MASIARGDSSSSTNPALQIYTAVGDPPGVIDVFSIGFRVFDISTPTKRSSPVQVFPALIGTFSPLDPVNAPPTGHRLGVGHYFAPWAVPANEFIGDHRVEFQFKLDALSPYASLSCEFFVMEGTLATVATYCGVSEIRAEGYPSTFVSDDRILELSILATKYVNKATGRWFTPRTFTSTNPMVLDGRGGYILNLQIPIIRIDKVEIDYNTTFNPNFDVVDLSALRIYNRHLAGLEEPDDRENPMLAFQRVDKRYRVLSACLGEWGFPHGHQNVRLEGVFGYTDPDGSPFGSTPVLIKKVTCLLVIRELRLESDSCEKLSDLNRFRIIADKQGKMMVRLQELWLKGGFTGDPRIDQILTAYMRPGALAVV